MKLKFKTSFTPQRNEEYASVCFRFMLTCLQWYRYTNASTVAQFLYGYINSVLVVNVPVCLTVCPLGS